MKLPIQILSVDLIDLGQECIGLGPVINFQSGLPYRIVVYIFVSLHMKCVSRHHLKIKKKIKILKEIYLLFKMKIKYFLSKRVDVVLISTRCREKKSSYRTRGIRTTAFYKNMRVSSGVIFEIFLNLWRSNQVFAQKVDFYGKKVAFYSNLPKVAF